LARGIEIHRAIQAKLEGRHPKLTLANSPYYYAALPYLEKVEAIALLESSVFHPEHGFAGTPDLVAKIQGEEWCLLDWKTTQKPRTKYQMQRDFHQAAAYLGACNWLYGWKLGKAKIITLLPSKESQVWEVEGKDLKRYWQGFLQHAHEYHQALELAK
jgi:predicted RecB family nuclease